MLHEKQQKMLSSVMAYVISLLLRQTDYHATVFMQELKDLYAAS